MKSFSRKRFFLSLKISLSDRETDSFLSDQKGGCREIFVRQTILWNGKICNKMIKLFYHDETNAEKKIFNCVMAHDAQTVADSFL